MLGAGAAICALGACLFGKFSQRAYGRVCVSNYAIRSGKWCLKYTVNEDRTKMAWEFAWDKHGD